MKGALEKITDDLARDVDALVFHDPVAYVYNPLGYARRAYDQYLARYGRGTKETIFLGMNPGPFGMTQTGVPFGEVSIVRDYLGIEAPIDPVEGTHPKRPIEGFACTRSEVSGARFWGWIRSYHPNPDTFFERFFVVNYCPLVFLEESGRNRTPDKLPIEERSALYAACDRALERTIDHLAPSRIIGIGAFGRSRAEGVLGGREGLAIGSILHPSPASPRANRGWAEAAGRDLSALGVSLLSAGR